MASASGPPCACISDAVQLIRPSAARMASSKSGPGSALRRPAVVSRSTFPSAPSRRSSVALCALLFSFTHIMRVAVAHPGESVCLFVSLFAVSRRFSLQPSCHLAVVPLSSFSPLSFPPLSRRSLLPRPATPPPAGKERKKENRQPPAGTAQESGGEEFFRRLAPAAERSANATGAGSCALR